jgi:hypothetical protein
MSEQVVTPAAPSAGAASRTFQGAPADDLALSAIVRRGIDAAIWGMPVVNYDLMRQQMLTKTAGKANEVIYWGRPLDWRNQTLTPNPDTLYLMTFFDTKAVGPVVIEIPPAGADGSLNANFMNVWQAPLEDAGLHGFDAGAGAKLLVLPPDHAEPIPDGYTVLRPGTWGGYALIRSNLPSHSPDDVARSIAYGKQVGVYPLALAAKPPPTTFTDVQNVVFDSTIRYDDSFFANLDRVIQEEPWLERDRAMIDVLRTLGIEKGKPFAPSDAVRQALGEAIRRAHAELEARYDAAPPAFFEGTHWTYPCPPELVQGAQHEFEEPDHYPVDARGLTYTYGYIGIKRLGAGQFYMINIKDRAGATYDGAKSYHLRVPPNAPIEQYWSITAYDRITHALIKGLDRASRASNSSEVKKNADGSVDLYLGPAPPAGLESNWIPTDPARPFELMFRAYAPTKALFEKTWKLPDVEEVVAH